MNTFVVDTNVPAVANGEAGAPPTCVAKCVERLRGITKIGKVVLDDGWRIIGEYESNLRSSGQPGVGDAFLKWVLTNYRNPSRCVLVAITPLRDSRGEDYAEFPRSLDLSSFDPADRKFVAVSLAHAERPPILEALDTDWWIQREALRAAGVCVEFVCPVEIERLWLARSVDGGSRRGAV